MQKLEESSAIELAKEMMGITDSTDSSGLNFNPETQEEFNELRDTTFCLFQSYLSSATNNLRAWELCFHELDE